MEEFQSEETNCIVINTEAGGTGISLHDINGVRPRLSLISPSFNAKTFAQVLGRIHRNGAKSDALQKVMIAADSIEEHVMQAIATKMQSMENIHRSNICTLTSNVYK
jgi:superfamily II DNA or RNA helicase